MKRVDAHGLKIAPVLFDFIAKEATPKTGISPDAFWAGRRRHHQEAGAEKPSSCSPSATRCRPRSMTGTAPTRASRSTSTPTPPSSRRSAICCRSPRPTKVETANVDEEIGKICGPQLVVPLTNARYALNAANARWGSLVRCASTAPTRSRTIRAKAGKGYNKARGDKVIAKAKAFLDAAVPLATGSHTDVTSYSVIAGQLSAKLKSGNATALKNASQFAGYPGRRRVSRP